ncbi:hypothetical protein GOV05_04290 [Candidatus Woesearchaeota archaeon]|nr:hypothetical protein [Candidatus Woesearchaeota archaeon]
MRTKTFIILTLLIFLGACEQTKMINDVVFEIPSETGAEPKIFFCPKTNCTAVFLDLIRVSSDIKCSLYDLDLEEIIIALKEKNAEVIIEDQNQISGFLTGYSSALMHNKFCVFDAQTVMTGSFNPTSNGAYKNNNNVFIIESEYLAINYLEEFNELKSNTYGGGIPTKHTKINFNNYIIQNFFCPDDGCRQKVLGEINKAKQSIYFMTFSFTDQSISDALINKKNEGLVVSGVFESKRTSFSYNKHDDLKSGGVTVYKDNNKYNMHHKVFIIDNQTVILGSYNPTNAGTKRNDENIIIINNPSVAQKYYEEYLTLY